MTDLTPEAAALFEEARTKHDPTDADCGRVLGALHARLGIPEAIASASLLEAASPATASTKAGTGATLLGAKVTKLVLASVVLGGTVSATLLGRPSPVARHTPLPVAAQVLDTATHAPDAALASASLSVTSLPEAAPPSTTRHARSHGRSHARRAHAATPASESAPAPALPSEVALIRRALTSLRDRDPNAALTLLETHASHYPDGLFRKEREGARVLALCAAGRVQEGRIAKAAFLTQAGSSPIAARVQVACRDD